MKVVNVFEHLLQIYLGFIYNIRMMLGHLFGQSEQFNQSIRYFDEQIRQIRETIAYREKNFS